MTVDDALPDRPLFEDEVDSLQADLPDGYIVRPGSVLDMETSEALIPTLSIRTPSGDVVAYGRNEDVIRWERIDEWDAEGYSDEKLVAAVGSFAEEHLGGTGGVVEPGKLNQQVKSQQIILLPASTPLGSV
ncbi:MAG: hypothetical protein ABEJ58_05835 [Halodesulfurarchaeum sp.]